VTRSAQVTSWPTASPGGGGSHQGAWRLPSGCDASLDSKELTSAPPCRNGHSSSGRITSRQEMGCSASAVGRPRSCPILSALAKRSAARGSARWSPPSGGSGRNGRRRTPSGHSSPRCAHSSLPQRSTTGIHGPYLLGSARLDRYTSSGHSDSSLRRFDTRSTSSRSSAIRPPITPPVGSTRTSGSP
jgi:hypothetical protein